MISNTSVDYWSVQITYLPVSITEDQLAQTFRISKGRIKIPANQKFNTYFAAWINDFNTEREAKNFVDQWSGASIFGTNMKCIALKPDSDNINVPRSSGTPTYPQPKPLIPQPQARNSSPTTRPPEKNVEGKRPLCPLANKGTCLKGSSECTYRHQRCQNFAACSNSNCDLAHAKRETIPKRYASNYDTNLDRSDPEENEKYPLSKPTVDDPPEVDIWIQFEGEQPTKVKLNYRNQPLVPGKRVPLDTSSSQPVVIRQILKPESVGPPIVSPVLQKPKDTKYILKDFHIIIDNSNVLIAAKTIRNKGGSTQTNPAIRVNVKNLARVLEAGKLQIEIRTRIVGGSTPTTTTTTTTKKERIWDEWKSCCYKCIVAERNGPENLVDNMLHAESYRVICYSDSLARLQVLVLVTGDGNKNSDQASFPMVVETALTRDWNVELWSWEQSLNPIYIDIQKHFPAQMTIKYLDSCREEITFLQKFN